MYMSVHVHVYEGVHVDDGIGVDARRDKFFYLAASVMAPHVHTGTLFCLRVRARPSVRGTATLEMELMNGERLRHRRRGKRVCVRVYSLARACMHTCV